MMLPIGSDPDSSRLVPLSQLLREGFSPELIARETHVTLNPKALERTLIPPEAFTKLREHLRTLNL
ncbi:MAG: hypothetical protein M3036_04015 [Bifidobacteriales bacterium]|nr:hypothetical protein [Bifidobacteriales bacterium]